MNILRKLTPFIFSALLIIALAACDTGDQAATESVQVNSQQNTYSKSQPLHQYDYSPERDELQQIYDARMKVVNTWTVIYSMGRPIFVCPSKGYPIPYTTQLTNPDQVQGTAAVVPQAEPNGLYTGTSAATWVLCIRTLPGGKTEIDPVYSEPDAVAFPYPVSIDANGNIKDAGGDSSVSINVKK